VRQRGYLECRWLPTFSFMMASTLVCLIGLPAHMSIIWDMMFIREFLLWSFYSPICSIPSINRSHSIGPDMAGIIAAFCISLFSIMARPDTESKRCFTSACSLAHPLAPLSVHVRDSTNLVPKRRTHFFPHDIHIHLGNSEMPGNSVTLL